MSEWWREKDYLGVEGEKILDENLSEDDIVSLILNDVNNSYNK